MIRRMVGGVALLVLLAAGLYAGGRAVGSYLQSGPGGGVSFQLHPGRFAAQLRGAWHRPDSGAGAFRPGVKLAGSDVSGVPVQG